MCSIGGVSGGFGFLFRPEDPGFPVVPAVSSKLEEFYAFTSLHRSSSVILQLWRIRRASPWPAPSYTVESGDAGSRQEPRSSDFLDPALFLRFVDLVRLLQAGRVISYLADMNDWQCRSCHALVMAGATAPAIACAM
jgi:hypothetical protein